MLVENLSWRDLPPYLAAGVALLGWLLTWIKNRREADLSYRAEVKELRAERLEWLTREESYEERLGLQEVEIAGLRKEVRHLQRIVPLALASQRLFSEETAEDLAWLLEKSGLLWWITAPVDQGHVLWACEAWGKLLGCETSDLLGAGWRRFLLVSDRSVTDGAEARAWRERVDGFVNCFVDSAGGRHELRWFAPAYPKGGGVTLALAIEAGKPPAG